MLNYIDEKMTNARKERLKVEKYTVMTKKLSLIELKNIYIYKKRYNVNNICAYRELALLEIKEVIIKKRKY